LLGRSPQFYGTVSVVLLLVVAVGLIVYAFGSDAWAAQRRPGSTAIRISNDEFSQKFSVSYFTKRLTLHIREAGGVGAASNQAQTLIDVCDQLVEETFLLRFGGELVEMPTDAEVDTKIAARLGLPTPTPVPSPDASASPTTSEPIASPAGSEPTLSPTASTDLSDRFKQEYERSGLSESEYKDMIRAEVLREKVLAKFKAEIPASVESVHYRQILVGRQTEADDLKGEIQRGGDFVALAKQKSLDSATKDKGGDVGFAPRGLLAKAEEDALFPLAVNQVTTFAGDVGCPPAPLTGVAGSPTLVLQVTEKVPDRPIDDDKKSAIAETSLRNWLNQKRLGDEQHQAFKIVNEMDPVSGDADKRDYALKRAYTQTP